MLNYEFMALTVYHSIKIKYVELLWKVDSTYMLFHVLYIWKVAIYQTYRILNNKYVELATFYVHFYMCIYSNLFTIEFESY